MNNLEKNPKTEYGKLIEDMHFSGYSYERAKEKMFWFIEDPQRITDAGFDSFNQFVRSIDLSSFKLTPEQRKEISRPLYELGATQREIAGSLGVDHRTIGNDLRGGEKSPKEEEKCSQTEENQYAEAEFGENFPNNENDILEPEVETIQDNEPDDFDNQLAERDQEINFNVFQRTQNNEILTYQLCLKKAIELKAGSRFIDWMKTYIIYLLKQDYYEKSN